MQSKRGAWPGEDLRPPLGRGLPRGLRLRRVDGLLQEPFVEVLVEEARGDLRRDLRERRPRRGVDVVAEVLLLDGLVADHRDDRRPFGRPGPLPGAARPGEEERRGEGQEERRARETRNRPATPQTSSVSGGSPRKSSGARKPSGPDATSVFARSAERNRSG